MTTGQFVRPYAKIRTDPTRTKVLRDRYATDARVRFRGVKSLIRETIVDNDAFGLKPGSLFPLAKGRAATRFDFPSSQLKQDAFMKWLAGVINDDILEIHTWDNGVPVSRAGWQDRYVRSAYARAVEQGNVSLARIGIVVPPQTIATILDSPIHLEQLNILFNRNFEELRGITSAMSQQIGRVLIDGLAQGQNPLTIARGINGRIQAIGIVRANTLARTEIIRTHAEGTLNRYEQMGVAEVAGFAEFSTANEGVCPICEGLEGDVYKISEARGLIPVHPNCRCTWLPVLSR